MASSFKITFCNCFYGGYDLCPGCSGSGVIIEYHNAQDENASVISLAQQKIDNYKSSFKILKDVYSLIHSRGDRNITLIKKTIIDKIERKKKELAEYNDIILNNLYNLYEAASLKLLNDLDEHSQYIISLKKMDLLNKDSLPMEELVILKSTPYYVLRRSLGKQSSIYLYDSIIFTFEKNKMIEIELKINDLLSRLNATASHLFMLKSGNTTQVKFSKASILNKPAYYRDNFMINYKDKAFVYGKKINNFSFLPFKVTYDISDYYRVYYFDVTKLIS